MDTNNPVVKPVYRTFHGPWHGDSKIVLGIDIGTTYSGVGFTYLCRGHEQMLHRVDKWPGQEGQHFRGKVPSVIWYNSDGQVMSFGAEALTSETRDDAEEAEWQLAKHFKLHLHPSTLRSKHKVTLEELPFGVSLKQIYTDFLGYLLRCTQERFEEVIIDGRAIWKNYSSDMDIVLAHPNGWGLREQDLMRRAAVLAGITTEENADSKIRFVTEAEASVHYCMHYTTLRGCLEPDMSFAVCDAGGSTVDTTVYVIETIRPKLQLSEKRASACVQAGAIFIDKKAELYLRRHFADASLSEKTVEAYVAAGLYDFEYREKLRFGGTTTDLRIKVAESSLKDTEIGIRSGKLKVSGPVVQARIFDPCINDIIESVSSQIEEESVSHLLLVGGLGANPYLYRRLKARFEHPGCFVTQPNDETFKAVAEGAVIWYCANVVVKRAPRAAYGVDILKAFDLGNPSHRLRKKIVRANHEVYVAGGWSEIVPKDIPVDCDSFSRQSYVRLFSTPFPNLVDIRDEIIVYLEDGVPEWAKTRSGELAPGFQNLGTVVTDLSGMCGNLKERLGPHHSQYWTLHFDICIRFGRTELEAFLEWEENGATKTGKAKVIPIPELELA
ncbi:unnamed protein product [Rhizoctonia solani]|uniref:Heat shock 70 kDa protein 12A n=1 Tax=Rhizoctonia solani TaxID=456999 RepID=A0A8H2WFQ4_9AGAM|nr:unnamed protein product [Rhizoctonia solani]